MVSVLMENIMGVFGWQPGLVMAPLGQFFGVWLHKLGLRPG